MKTISKLNSTTMQRLIRDFLISTFAARDESFMIIKLVTWACLACCSHIAIAENTTTGHGDGLSSLEELPVASRAYDLKSLLDSGWLDNERQRTSLAFKWNSKTFPNAAIEAEDLDVAAPGAEVSGGGGMTQAETDAAIAEAMLNPLSHLWLLFTQNDTIHYEGDKLDALGLDDPTQNITLLMPVLSQQLTENWKMIFRPVIPILNVKTLDNVDISTSNVPSVTGVNLERKSGLGDIVLWAGFSKQYKPPVILGFGITTMLDTATDERLGTGKYSAGPMALAFSITEKWVLGVVAQHWWSFAGDDHTTIDTSLGPVEVKRPDVNLTDIQPVIRYRVSPLTNIGMAPNWRYNHETHQLDLPIGIGFDTLIKIGPLPAKIGLEAYYFVEQSDDFGPKWQIRFLFVPVIPSPGFSKKPLFGNF